VSSYFINLGYNSQNLVRRLNFLLLNFQTFKLLSIGRLTGQHYVLYIQCVICTVVYDLFSKSDILPIASA